MAGSKRPHSRLTSELQALSEDARTLWEHAAARTDALQRVLAAIETGDAEKALQALARIDRAVVEALDLLGFSRGIRPTLLINPFGPPAFTAASGELHVGTEWIRRNLNVHRNPDTTFRSWVQESVHLRQPFAETWLSEYRRYSGYEEGLAEGVALLVTCSKAGLSPAPNRTYASYVRAGELLAGSLRFSPEALYRTLWRLAPGEIREGFPNALNTALRTRKRPLLTEIQVMRLRDAADELFSSCHSGEAASDAAIIELWQRALS